jgi:hypothetical protein
MPTNTYVELKKETVTTPVASVTISGIDQGYTDLVLVANGSTTTAGRSLLVKFNSDSTSIYSDTGLYGTGGGSGTSYKTPNNTVIGAGEFYNYNTTTILNFPGYSNTTTWKNLIGRANSASNYVQSFVGLRRDTSAITSITLTVTSDTFAAGTTFSLYGIKAWAAETTPKATGGYVYQDSTYWYHAFPFSSTFVPNQSLTADILVVAGGGGGGYFEGGGGAGGLLTFASQALTATTYQCVVGSGGAGDINIAGSASNGVNSQFGALTAAVGGGGGGSFENNGNNDGAAGGSGGGGGGADNAGILGTGGAPTSGQGFAGGNGTTRSTYHAGGGGGGAGGAGQTAPDADTPGNGGIGATSTLIQSIGTVTGFGHNSNGTFYFAGGGGGGANNLTFRALTNGGVGGGGVGGYGPTNVDGQSGMANTGGGGGGNANDNGNTTQKSRGGSGIIVVRYAK